MKTRKITTAFAASVAALLFGTVAAFGAEPRVWTNSRGEIALRGTLDVERTLDETPGVEAPNRVYFVDATGDLYSFRYRHLSEADRALVDEALDEPAPPKKVGTRRDVAPPLGTPLFTPSRRSLRVLPTENAPSKETREALARRSMKLPPSTPLQSFSLRIADADGNPLPYCRVVIRAVDADKKRARSQHLLGEKTLVVNELLPFGRYEATITPKKTDKPSEYDETRSERKFFEVDETTKNVDLILGAKEEKDADVSVNAEEKTDFNDGLLKGIPATTLKVVGSDGKPIPGAKIEFKGRGALGGVSGDLTVDAQGVQIVRVPSGEYDATATTANGRSDGLTFVVPNEENAVVELKIGGETKPVDEAKPEEDAANADGSETADAQETTHPLPSI